MAKRGILDDMLAAAPNRRNFVKKLGIASAALGFVAAPKGRAQSTTTTTSTPAISDIDILNFALNLEYLEAEFYTVATTGMTISQIGLTVTGSGTPGPTTGGNMVSFSAGNSGNSSGTGSSTGTGTSGTSIGNIQAIAMELAMDEQTHVTLLQGAITGLGGKPIAKPAINLGALGIGFASQAQFLTLARAFEDIGVTAYGGAAPLIQNKAILGTAARILAVEAEHAGNIRLLVAQNSIPTTALDALDHPPPPSGSQFFSTNSMALTETRTRGQVLYLAYGNQANATAGGFFPNGVNGNPALTMSSGPATATSNVELTATPNPIPVIGSNLGSTTICFNAPGSTSVQLRLGDATGADGPVLLNASGSGCFTTGPFLTNGSVIYLFDTSNGNSPTSANLLGTVTINLQSM